ncbi:pyridoxal phosphate-dependent aminotransferase [Consotaella salsifontis]|nr:aminotransferase class I/II-fold pyridoxal phosphate-dependent enzyme [Consotaella salsifontis]
MKASLRSHVDPFRAMDILSDANRMIARGDKVISLAVGQPSAPAPQAVAEAAREMLSHGRVAYTDALGRWKLRERIAQHYRETYGCAVSPEQVMVTTGSSAGFNLAFLAAFDVGERIAIAAPGYPAYRNILKALGLEPVEIEVSADDGYILTAERLAAEHRAKPVHGVLIASPSNPTGTVTPREELKRLVDFADSAGIRFISDEIYHGLVYSERETSALEFSDSPIVVNSFSKYYCMTGWRIGWLVLPPSLVRAAERIGQSLYISAPDISQIAALAAFSATDELETIKAGYRANRDRLIERLPQLGFSEIAPIDGAFYAYAAIPEGQGSASEWSKRLLDEAHVAITMGVDFDLRRGERFARLSYCCSETELTDALDRIEQALR